MNDRTSATLRDDWQDHGLDHWGIRPFRTFWPLTRPAPIRVLVVADGAASFDPDDHFGLTEFVAALKDTVFYFTRYEVTTAHRSPKDPTPAFLKSHPPDLFGFSFDDPAQFGRDRVDVVFLFGFYAELDDHVGNARRVLTDGERAAVARFMDAGGGVFATGDHEDLGADLCGSLPRVRHMRRWTFDETKYGTNTGQTPWDQFDPDSGWAPPKLGRYRHDTLVADASGAYLFENQSDDRPAPIQVRMYRNGLFTHPHPLLCTPSGIIDILPDHMHEGECIVPNRTQLDGAYKAADYERLEYPKTKHGLRVAPEIVAWGVMDPGHRTTTTGYGTDSPVSGDSFGAIAVYDGHIVGIGRVVTDSTIHHFYNINLNGVGAPPNYVGFTQSPHYKVIKAYFRNLAWWLAPAPAQSAMMVHTVWAARWDSELRMLARFPEPGHSSLAEIVAYGRDVRRVLALYSSDCAVFSWSLQAPEAAIDPLYLVLPHWLYNLLHLPDPPPEGVAVTWEEISAVVCALAMTRTIRASRPNAIHENSESLVRTLLPELRKGAAEAFEAVGKAMRLKAEATGRLATAMESRR